jgi:parallel beta-helix repeat protein
VSIGSSYFIEFSNNTCKSNRYGFNLYSVNYISIRRNIFQDHRVAIFISFSDEYIYEENQFFDNSTNIEIEDSLTWVNILVGIGISGVIICVIALYRKKKRISLKYT